MGEDLGEGSARRVIINECTTLSPSPLPLTKRLSIVLFGRVSARGVSAFTLAEVLITLVIIGVIAAITVPTLITKYQKEQTVTRLKKVYSSLAQTTNKAIADNGPINTWKYASAEDSNSLKFIQTYIMPYMNIMDKCMDSQEKIKTDGGCAFQLKYLNPSESDITLGNSYPRFILADGTSILMYSKHDAANGDYCQVYIDINGAKKPNKLGKDIFIYFYYIKKGTNNYSIIYNGKFVPDGIILDRSVLLSKGGYGVCNKSAPAGGLRCAALIMKDGWRIADDYPW